MVSLMLAVVARSPPRRQSIATYPRKILPDRCAANAEPTRAANDNRADQPGRRRVTLDRA
jgi:hypothetical protein